MRGKKLFCRHLDKPLIFLRNISSDETNMAGGKRSVWQCPDCGKLILRSAPFRTGSVSDGYHTFDELYHHRAILFSVVCAAFPERAWKSMRHADGTMYSDMFIVGIDTQLGQATYHYDVEPYWDMFRVKELIKAPEWDGHTPAQAITRIRSLALLLFKEAQNEKDN